MTKRPTVREAVDRSAPREKAQLRPQLLLTRGRVVSSSLRTVGAEGRVKGPKRMLMRWLLSTWFGPGTACVTSCGCPAQVGPLRFLDRSLALLRGQVTWPLAQLMGTHHPHVASVGLLTLRSLPLGPASQVPPRQPPPCWATGRLW